MSSWEEIQAVKVKRNSLREKLEKRKKERQDLLLGNSSPAGSGGVVSLIKLESGGGLGDDKGNKLLLTTIKQDQGTGSADIDAEVEKCLVKVLADPSLILPTNSTQITERVESMMQKTAPLRDSVAYYLHKLASQNLINIKEVSIGGTVGYEVISAEHTRIQALHDDLGLSHVPMAALGDRESIGKRKALDGDEDELLLKGSGSSKLARSAGGLKEEGHRGKGASAADSSSSSSSSSSSAAAASVACQASDIMSLLSLPSTREKQHKKVGEEILELLSKPTAKERSLAEKFKSQGGAQVMEFCPHGTRIECMRSLDAANEAAAAAAASAAKERSDSDGGDERGGRTDGETGTKPDSNSDNQSDRGSRSKNGADRGSDTRDVKKELTTDPGTDAMSPNSNSNSSSSGAAPEPDSKQQTAANKYRCNKLHFKKIIQNHTDETLGDCSFLNTCFHMDTCKYVHYQVDTYQTVGQTGPGGALAGALAKPDGKSKAKVKPKTLDSAIVGGAAVGGGGAAAAAGVGAKRSPITNEPCATLYPPQWIQCDLRFLDMTVLGKFAVVMADPPWDIHMELPYGTMSDDEMRQLGVPALQDDGLIFLWVTGRAMELGRECLKLWGYERVDELIWVKTNQLQRIIRTGRTGHWLNHGKEHCLVGMKGNPPNLNRGLDCDVIVAEVRATSHKPDEIYGIIERLSPGTRKIELFGRPHNVQPNWITLGNQLDGIQIVDPELISSFRNRYPDGNCMTPGKNP
ncbi:N6-adenosine-methyltransferase MT-A70-like protein isoform X1 [Anopheles aquasalis]|uniref:N6-adenosine-methyltransferase MT-A70-like protein isoform X1 n=2 Tax=Anopheles aquasalis TaxID=42839 RepID=UPI00215A4CD9|nr:N6-adenosine-methyltransferase MT-A70-like protein isoform X1 [Anopheles aquasalis]